MDRSLGRPANLSCRGTWDRGVFRVETQERPWNFRQGIGGVRTRISGTVERVSWRDRGTVGEAVEQVRGSNSGNRAEAEGTGEHREKAAGEHKGIKSKLILPFTSIAKTQRLDLPPVELIITQH